MGNCQAAEAATVVIQHPGNDKVERIYWSVCANQVMNSNPGHYVALICENAAAGAPPGRQLKLLRPDDILLLGQVYRLISFEDVLKGFAAKRCVKVRKTLQEGGASNAGQKKTNSDANPRSANSCSMKTLFQTEHNYVPCLGSSGRAIIGGGLGRYHVGGGQWRPSLQSIAEIGT